MKKKWQNIKNLIITRWFSINTYLVFILVLTNLVLIHYTNNIFDIIKIVVSFSLSMTVWLLLNYFKK